MNVNFPSLEELFSNQRSDDSPLVKMEKNKVISDVIQKYLLNNKEIPSCTTPLSFIRLEGDQIVDAHLIQIAKIPTKALFLNKCSNISTSGLKCLKNINKLVLFDFEKLTDDCVLDIPESIQNLWIKECKYVTDVGVSNLKKSRSLNSFEINDCPNVSSIYQNSSSFIEVS